MGSTLRYIGSVISGFFKIWFLVLLGLLSIVLIVYLAIIVPHNKLATFNIKNVQMIKSGMTSEEVLVIMGEKGLFKNTWGEDSVYSYEAGLFSSSNIEIIFNDCMRVRNVIVPEGIVSPTAELPLKK